MADDVYVRLREFLDELPGGFRATKSGIELKILKKLFTPEQAEIAVHLSLWPEPPAAIAPRIGMDEGAAAQKLESMAKEGLINRVHTDAGLCYMALQFVVGIYEFHVNTLDRELAELIEAYFPFIARTWTETKTKQLRVVPINKALDTSRTVATYDSIRELIKEKKLITVAPCICQKERELMGKTCSRPLERCIQFDHAAQYYLDNGLGRRISADELLSLLAMGEEQALVLSPTNVKDILNICMCCGCCCGVLNVLKRLPRPADHVQAPFQAEIDVESCTACGTCVERCQMQAVIENDTACTIDTARCIGCALCVPTCPQDAISLVPKPETAPVPDSIEHLYARILEERGKR